MAHNNFVGGHARTPLVFANSVSISGAFSPVGSTAVDVGPYSRITGLFSCVGSVSLQLKTGAASGYYLSTSVFALNSGTGVIDTLNYGKWADIQITASNSQPGFNLHLMGEPIR